MNFVDYCIATKNYSALSTVNKYTKVFGRTHQEITNPVIRRHMLLDLVSHRATDKCVKPNFLDTNGEDYKSYQDKANNDPNNYYYNYQPDDDHDKKWVKYMWKIGSKK